MRSLLPLLLPLLVAACASRWEPLESASALQRDQDLYACMTEHTYDRASASAESGRFRSSRGMEVQGQLVNQCMKARGYQRATALSAPSEPFAPPSSWIGSVSMGANSTYERNAPSLYASGTLGVDRNLGPLVSVGARGGYRRDVYGTALVATRLPPLPSVGLSAELGGQSFGGGVLPVARGSLFVDIAAKNQHSARAECGLESPLGTEVLLSSVEPTWTPIIGGCQIGWRAGLGR